MQNREDMTNNDGEFKQETKSLIAIKAGFQCSFPGCSVLTGIPRGMLNNALKESESFSETLLAGEAAHIIGRSDQAARGNACISKDCISSEENGIWLCSNHHKMIDTLRMTYGEATIKRWKRQQEELVKTISQKVTNYENPEIYIDEPTLNSVQFNKCVNANKIITALECDENYKDYDMSFFNKSSFLNQLNDYFKEWSTVPYRARKLASIALLRIICDSGENHKDGSFCSDDPMWLRVRTNNTVFCSLTTIHESIRELKFTKYSKDGSWQSMIDTHEFFTLINNIVSIKGVYLAKPSWEKHTFIDNDLEIRTTIFKSDIEGRQQNNPNVWELVRYVYKKYFANNPAFLVDSLIVHGNAAILDITEQNK